MLRIAAALAPSLISQLASSQEKNPGYTNTPILPDGYRVHDALRPRPPVVDPGPAAKTPAAAPKDAVVLFDGTNLDAWKGRKGEAKWKLVEGGAMEVSRTGDIQSKAEFGDCQLHIEWMAPPPKGTLARPRQQRRILLRPLRSAGARQLREPDLRRRTSRGDLRAEAALRQRHATAGPMERLRHRLHRAAL